METDHALCTFQLDHRWFGIPVKLVQEVMPAPPVTPVPLAPCWVAGLVNLRGQVLTVIDLRRRLGLPERQAAVAEPVVVVVRSGSATVGLLVDEVGEVLEEPEEALTAAPANLLPESQQLVLKVCKLPRRLLQVLDLDRVVGGDDDQTQVGNALKEVDHSAD
jgi:purine-binding chemotaxis protein CheW